jgi:DNA-binding Lrp family transcriptional regulator
MGVWNVPGDAVDDFAEGIAEFKAVSHGYLRPVYPDWPYNVFTTVHGRSVDECESVLAEIATATGVSERASLYPTRELKRARIAFFSPDVEQWESSRLERSSESAVS